jgi:hypothetical protein
VVAGARGGWFEERLLRCLFGGEMFGGGVGADLRFGKGAGLTVRGLRRRGGCGMLVGALVAEASYPLWLSCEFIRSIPKSPARSEDPLGSRLMSHAPGAEGFRRSGSICAGSESNEDAYRS